MKKIEVTMANESDHEVKDNSPITVFADDDADMQQMKQELLELGARAFVRKYWIDSTVLITRHFH